MLPRERVGGHHARDCAGSWGLPPQRPARTLPHRGPNAPISEEPLGGVGSEVQSEGEVPKAVFAVPSEADGEVKAWRGPSLLWGGSSVARGTGSGEFRSRSGVVCSSRDVRSELGVFWSYRGQLGSLRYCPELAVALSRSGAALVPKQGCPGWCSLSLFLLYSDLPQLH